MPPHAEIRSCPCREPPRHYRPSDWLHKGSRLALPVALHSNSVQSHHGLDRCLWWEWEPLCVFEIGFADNLLVYTSQNSITWCDGLKQCGVKSALYFLVWIQPRRWDILSLLRHSWAQVELHFRQKKNRISSWGLFAFFFFLWEPPK